MRARRGQEGVVWRPARALKWVGSTGYERSPTLHMFEEDVRLHLLPVGGQNRWPESFKVSIDGSAEEQAKVLLLASSLNHYDHREPAEVICDAFVQLAAYMASQGIVHCEIVRSTTDPSKATLHPFLADNVYSLLGLSIQVAPVREWSRLRKCVLFRPSDVWCVEIPPALGGKNRFRSLLRSMKGHAEIGPAFLQHDIEQNQFPQDFSFKDYHRYESANLMRLTRLWGWTRRDTSAEFMTEYFVVQRRLRSRLAMAMLRNHLVAEFNRLLGQLEIAALVGIDGLPSPTDILDTERRLQVGDIGFAKAHKATSFEWKEE